MGVCGLPFAYQKKILNEFNDILLILKGGVSLPNLYEKSVKAKECEFEIRDRLMGYLTWDEIIALTEGLQKRKEEVQNGNVDFKRILFNV